MELLLANYENMTANTSSCKQPVDDTSGLIYQAADCNADNGLLLMIALCNDDETASFEVYVNIEEPPTTSNYIKKNVLTPDMRNKDGFYVVKYHKKILEMPPSGGERICIIGVRTAPGKY